MKKVIANALVAVFLVSMLSVSSIAVTPKACPHSIEWTIYGLRIFDFQNDFDTERCHKESIISKGVCTRCGRADFKKEGPFAWENHRYPSGGGYCEWYGDDDCRMSSFDVRRGQMVE